MSAGDEKSFENAIAATRVARLERARDLALAVVIAAGLLCSFLLTRWLDARRPPAEPFAAYEELYITPEAARRMSLGFNGVVADWYWLRSLQYVGRKAAAHEGDLNLDDLRPLDLRNLAALLEHATTLDPQFMAVYDFGAVVLPAVDEGAATKLLEKGVRENPAEWRLYQHLGYVHWQAGRFSEASEKYHAGARLPGAPAWMRAMAAQVEVYGGRRDTAREIYRRMHDETDDEQIRALAIKRLLQIASLDERDAILRALRDFQTRNARCPVAWREVSASLRAAKLKLDSTSAPLDPTGTPYALDQTSCDAKLHPRSQIPRK